MTISATVACGKDGAAGLLGVDLYFSNIAEDVTYYSNNEEYNYGFILTNQGSVIAHPSYPRPLVNNKQPVFVDVGYLEKVDNFSLVRQKILQEPEGFAVLNTRNSTVSFMFLSAFFFKFYSGIAGKICLETRNKMVYRMFGR